MKLIHLHPFSSLKFALAVLHIGGSECEGEGRVETDSEKSILLSEQMADGRQWPKGKVTEKGARESAARCDN